MTAPEIIEIDIDESPTDMEIIVMMAAVFDMEFNEVIDRLQGIDFKTARGGYQ